jgi:hypothetical protein
MAKRPARSLIKLKPKKEKKTRSEVYMVNLKYLGDEPTYRPGQVLTFSEKARAYTWYGSMTDMSDAREWLSDYLGTKGRKDEVKRLKSVPDNLFPHTCAWIARMAMKGVVVDEETEKFFNKRLQLAFAARSTEDDKKEEKPAAEKPNIQDRIKDRVNDLIGDLEEVLDRHARGEISEFDAYEFCQKAQIPAQHTTKMAAYYAGHYEELELALDGSDPQVKEGYSGYSKKWIRARLEFIEKMMTDLLRYGQNTKKLKAPRKKKPQSVEKKLKHFRYQKEFQELKLASVAPEQVVGAQELWTYNTKYKTLSVFRAIDRGGLDIKRSSIVNFDEKTTMTRRTGRQAEKIVQSVLSGGKVALRKVMDDLKEATLQDRINENTILLRVIKQ